MTKVVAMQLVAITSPIIYSRLSESQKAQKGKCKNKMDREGWQKLGICIRCKVSVRLLTIFLCKESHQQLHQQRLFISGRSTPIECKPQNTLHAVANKINVESANKVRC